jgi:hypothetical protein
MSRASVGRRDTFGFELLRLLFRCLVECGLAVWSLLGLSFGAGLQDTCSQGCQGRAWAGAGRIGGGFKGWGGQWGEGGGSHTTVDVTTGHK